MVKIRILAVAIGVLSVVLASTARAQIDPGVAAATFDNVQGNLDSIVIDSPWAVSQNLEVTGVRSRLRYFYDRLYVVLPQQDEIRVIDPETWDTVRTLSFGNGSSPEDILPVSPQRAYVSLYDSTELQIVDPRNGAPRGSIDLSGFADADGSPEMSMLARDGSRLFVQLQRVDRLTNNAVRPSLLAVVDLDNDMLIDVDQDTPGTQGIVLHGTIPSFRMHVDVRARRLFVSTPGARLSTSGGIEEIDLDALTSLGFILSEEEVSADVGGFVMTSADAGYALSHTDIVASSHLFPFSRTGGQGFEIMLTFGFIETLAYDAATGQLFFPDPFGLPFGVHVIDTATDTVVTPSPIATGLPPWDVAVVRKTTPGEVRDVVASGLDPSTGELTLGYRPACGAANHNVAYGPLAAVSTYGYADQLCGVGTSGSVSGFDPGPESTFFLIVGTDGDGAAGSYGADGAAAERPPFDDPSCPFVQDLGFSCDR